MVKPGNRGKHLMRLLTMFVSLMTNWAYYPYIFKYGEKNKPQEHLSFLGIFLFIGKQIPFFQSGPLSFQGAQCSRKQTGINKSWWSFGKKVENVWSVPYSWCKQLCHADKQNSVLKQSWSCNHYNGSTNLLIDVDLHI